MIEPNKIYNEDCLLGMQSIPDQSIDLVVTDCPYHICTGGGMSFRGEGCMFSSKHKATKDGKFFADNDIKFNDWLPVIYNKLKDGTHCYIMVNSRNLAELQTEAEKVGFKYHNLLIWDKGNCTPNRWYMQAFECILFLRKGNIKTINNPSCTTILRVSNIHGNKFHPTEKPVELMQLLITNSSQKGDLVLDPFMGSGTTAIACLKEKRHFIGFELNEEYYRKALRRIQIEQMQPSLF